MSTLCSELSLVYGLVVAIMDLCVVYLVSCGLVVVVLLFVGCRQFLGIVEAGTWFLYLKIFMRDSGFGKLICYTAMIRPGCLLSTDTKLKVHVQNFKSNKAM
jgi:hypothetical protein